MSNYSDITPLQIENDRRVLELLSQNFRNISAASTEIINLEAILNLPKGTEHFVADLHGEYEAFLHILKNASGNIKRKVTELFQSTMTEREIRELCSLIYYPEQKLEYIRAAEENPADFYHTTLHRLVRVCQSVSSKYTRSKVRKALPREFAYIIEELLHESPSDDDKQDYFNRIIETIATTGQADEFITALCNVIQRLSIDQLHILGDIFDRGPGAHIIMDTLCNFRQFDVQWGNHDALWMGAAAGNDCCIANVLRLSLRYGNMATLEDGYGINLVPLATFAMETYANDPCDLFGPHLDKDDTTHNEKTRRLIAQMHKAISIIQFKLEAALIDKRPEWRMQDRKLLEYIDFQHCVFTKDGRNYVMKDTFFPTVDPEHPYALTAEEKDLVKKLHHSFRVSDKLKKHIQCLFSHGCMYGVYNSNLLFHASMPLNADGTLKEVDLNGKKYKGKDLFEHIGRVMRSAFNSDTAPDDRKFAVDYFWYLWCGADSPLFDKSKMTTFERYFLEDPDTHKEEKGYYYTLRDNEEICDRILDAFGVKGAHRHIINGHVPVRAAKGEKPIKANGKLMVIDGGFAKAYHDTTGIAGYTLVYHSRGFQLVQHEPFTSAEEAITNGTDIVSTTQIVEMSSQRMRVCDTDKGQELMSQIQELTELLYAYRHGIIKERAKK
ncbi:MAG: fructose-1,6-bisphosphatase [Paraprevotella sp.]|nr:fructose-1,6-bisphosphatase [Paraprevotella sp.]